MLANYLSFRVEHTLPSSGSFFIRSNASCNTYDTSDVLANFTVGMNPDLSATEVLFLVSVATSTSELLHNTGACFNDIGNDRGLFLYVRSNKFEHSSLHLSCGTCQVTRNVTSADYLELNISVLFPRTELDTNLDNFITYLPGFTQTFRNLTGYVYFKNLAIEGAWQDVLSTVSGIPFYM